MFINSLPIFFTYIQLGSPLDLLLIALLIYVVVYLSMPFIASGQDQTCIALTGLSFYKYLLYSLMGQLKLWVVFWPFFILLNISLYLIDTLAMQGHFTVTSWDEVHFILLTPAIFWMISVWRNSSHTKWRLSGAGARFMTLAVVFEYVLKLVIRDDYPRIFFACQDIMLDYASCF